MAGRSPLSTIPQYSKVLTYLSYVMIKATVVLSTVVSPLVVNDFWSEVGEGLDRGVPQVQVGSSSSSSSSSSAFAGVRDTGTEATYRTLGDVTRHQDVMVSKQKGLFESVPSGLTPSQHVAYAVRHIKLHELVNGDAHSIEDDLRAALDYCACTSPQE